MAYVWKHPASPFWTAVYRDDRNVWVKKSTKQTKRTKAMAMALEWERASSMGREMVLTEAKSREVLSDILERTTGEKLRQSTVKEFLTTWIRRKEHSRQERTAERYQTTVDRFLKHLGKKADLPITAITPLDCQKFYDEMLELKLAPATLRTEMKTISGAFNAALRLGLISTNPAASVELPDRIQKSQVSRLTFTEAQVQILLDAADQEWRTCIMLGYYAGLRLLDAVMCPWSAVDFQKSQLKIDVQKTGEVLAIPMHSCLEAYLSKMAGDSTGPISPGLAASRVGGRSGLSRKFIALMGKAGISSSDKATAGKRKLAQLSFHALRKTFNSVLHNKDVSQELRRKLTGHKSDAVNDRYTSTELQTLRDAVVKLPTLNA